MAAALRVRGEFIAGASGPLALVSWEPDAATRPAFAVLYLPPFGDEMNKSRRTVALQARALAAMGGMVALLDPYGTGDSSGDHGDATWEGWQDDAVRAFESLAQRSGATPILWGLRLGATLAMQVAPRVAPKALVLWQPVLRGKVFVNQLLRLATVQQRVDGAAGGSDAARLRDALAAGSAIEVAGYRMRPELVAPIEASDLVSDARVTCPIIWRDVSATPLPASEDAAGRLRERGLAIDIECVAGPSFWMTQEIEEAPALIESTSAAVTRAAP